MLEDRFGLPLSTTSASARDAYVSGVDGLLTAAADAERQLGRAIDADPRFALAHIANARALLMRAQVPEARASAAQARDLAVDATPREQAHVNALALAIEGKPVESLAATREHLLLHPRDALVLAPATGVFGLIGFSGRLAREQELDEFLRTLAPFYGEDWWFASARAFAACECGRLDEAQMLIERSMAANPRNAHGAHIMSHVLYEGGELEAGHRYLEGWMPAYEREGLMHCHLSWHVAIFALATGRNDLAWQVYRNAVHPGGAWGPPLNVVTDAVSFLWRAELAGQPRDPELWRDLRDYRNTNFPRSAIAFVDVHAAAALVASGDAGALAILADELRERVATAKLPAGAVVPLIADGLNAYGAGQWELAADLLGKALPEMVRIGGSRAQRDLIVKTLVAACIKAGRNEQAQELIAQRKV